MTMVEPENAERFVEVLKEIRDELHGLRMELGSRGARMPSGIRTSRLNRGALWRSPALAAAGVAGLALVLGLALRDRPAPQPATVAVAPQVSAPKSETPAAPATPPQGVSPVQAPVAAHLAVPVVKPTAAASAPAIKQAQRSPAGAPDPTTATKVTSATTMAAVPAVPKKRLKAEVAAGPPVEAASDDDETLAFPPSPRRVRVHRLSYGPVGSEPAKL
jgi:hypothetical protein